jgi:iron(III) transport system ATP-binding protein
MTIAVENVTKTFGSKVAIDDLSLAVDPGELLVLLGPSGCGKSTLLRCIAGLEQPDRGTVRLGDRVVLDRDAGVAEPPNRREVGFVFQSFALWPHMTVRQNIAYPLRAQRLFKQHRNRIDEVLAGVRCTELADRYPSQLSGGQQQRIALARALVAEPRVMLLDEPLSNLDALLRLELRHQLREIHQRFGFTALFVTHDQAEAMHVGTRIALMRDGRIEQVGLPREVYERPATPYAAEFLGVQNLVPFHRANGRWESAMGPLPAVLAESVRSATDAVELGFRAQDISLAPVGAAEGVDPRWVEVGRGVVDDLVYLGDHVESQVRMGAVTVQARLPRSEDRFTPGAEVAVRVPASCALLYSDGILIEAILKGSMSLA